MSESQKPKGKYYPTPKTGAGALGGALATLIASLLTRRFGIELGPEEIGALVVISGYATSWLTDG